MVANLEGAHACSQRLDDSSAFMAEHNGLWRMAPGMLVKVRVADAGGNQADQHLACAGSFQFQ